MAKHKVCYFMLVRLFAILKELQNERFPNSTALAVRFEVSAKTIQRDFDALRYYFKAPIEYSAARRGFYLTNKGWRLEGE